MHPHSLLGLFTLHAGQGRMDIDIDSVVISSDELSGKISRS